MAVRFSVGQYTTPHLSFAEDLAVYQEAGAEGIGIDAGLKLRERVDDLARYRDSGLQATFCMPAPNSVFPGRHDRGPADPARRVDAMCDGVRELAPYEPVCLVIGTGPIPEDQLDEAYPFAVDSLRRVARAAADVGQTIAFEPLHASLGASWSFLTDLPTTLKLIEDVGEPNTGVLFDVWHLWDTPNVEEVLAANVGAVLGVHVDDWRSPTRSWCDRVLPGDGIANPARHLQILREGGYDGFLELEIFSDDGFFEQELPDSLWAQDPVELIRRGRERTLAAWAGDRQAMGAG
jgi:sugar phosphate isomerase/epimerase